MPLQKQACSHQPLLHLALDYACYLLDAETYKKAGLTIHILPHLGFLHAQGCCDAGRSQIATAASQSGDGPCTQQCQCQSSCCCIRASGIASKAVYVSELLGNNREDKAQTAVRSLPPHPRVVMAPALRSVNTRATDTDSSQHHWDNAGRRISAGLFLMAWKLRAAMQVAAKLPLPLLTQ